MDTSYVAVGTVIYMITDSLTYRPQEKPRRSGAPLVCRAGNVGCLSLPPPRRWPALVFAQRLDGQPGPPQVGGCHRDRRLGQRLGGAVIGA
jgi:hypothetical protein